MEYANHFEQGQPVHLCSILGQTPSTGAYTLGCWWVLWLPIIPIFERKTASFMRGHHGTISHPRNVAENQRHFPVSQEERQASHQVCGSVHLTPARVNSCHHCSIVTSATNSEALPQRTPHSNTQNYGEQFLYSYVNLPPTASEFQLEPLPHGSIRSHPQDPEASDVRTACCSLLAMLTIEHNPFHMARKHPHHLRSEQKLVFSCTLWCKAFMHLKSSTMHQRNALPCLTTRHTCWSWPIMGSSSLLVQDHLSPHSWMVLHR